MPHAPTRYPRETWGNGSLLVLGDSRQTEFFHLSEAIFAALGHFGVPFRFWDLARRGVEDIDLSGCAGIVIAQEHFGHQLSSQGIAKLISAVEEGLGLVNFDHEVGTYGDALLLALGLAPSRPAGPGAIESVEELVVNHNDHFVSYTQCVGASHHLKAPLPAYVVHAHGARSRVLVESGQGFPLLVVARVGSGRAVQWLVSPKLWLRQYFGHAQGVDDLFWKGIVWAARKPFVMKALPPFVRLRFDDCNGHWCDADDFNFVEVLNAFGHKPTLCICMRAVTSDAASKISRLYKENLAEFAPHTLKPGTSIFYGDERGEYSSDELATILQEVDDHLRRWGIGSSKILSDHEHEYSSKVLPLLKERGIQFKMNITLPDERWTDIHVDWRPAPYGSMSYAFDYLPNSRDLFVVFNHYPTFDYARSYLPDGRFLYNRRGGYGKCVWDFLNGLTKHRDQRESNDIAAAAARLAAHVRLGLDSLFFGGSITHSHFARDLSLHEWRELLERYEALTVRHRKLNVGYDSIAEYARANVDTHLARVQRDADGGVFRCTIVGESRVPLLLYVFRDTDESVDYEFQPVPQFEGSTESIFGFGPATGP